MQVHLWRWPRSRIVRAVFAMLCRLNWTAFFLDLRERCVRARWKGKRNIWCPGATHNRCPSLLEPAMRYLNVLLEFRVHFVVICAWRGTVDGMMRRHAGRKAVLVSGSLCRSEQVSVRWETIISVMDEGERWQACVVANRPAVPSPRRSDKPRTWRRVGGASETRPSRA